MPLELPSTLDERRQNRMAVVASFGNTRNRDNWAITQARQAHFY